MNQSIDKQDAVPSYRLGSPVTNKLLDFAAGATVDDVTDLDDFVDFDWDTLYVFRDGDKRADVNAASGVEVFADPSGRIWTHSSLLVFVSNHSVAQAVMTELPLQVVGLKGKPYGRDSTQVRAMPRGEPNWLVLIDRAS